MLMLQENGLKIIYTFKYKKKLVDEDTFLCETINMSWKKGNSYKFDFQSQRLYVEW